MSEKINMNTESVQSILKKIKMFEEETNILLNEVDKNLSNAELEGWNDKKYYEFKDSFDDTKRMVNHALKKIDEEHIPFLTRLIRVAEDYN